MCDFELWAGSGELSLDEALLRDPDFDGRREDLADPAEEMGGVRDLADAAPEMDELPLPLRVSFGLAEHEDDIDGSGDVSREQDPLLVMRCLGAPRFRIVGFEALCVITLEGNAGGK